MTWLATLGTTIVLGHGTAMGNPSTTPSAKDQSADGAKEQAKAKHVQAALIAEDAALEPGTTAMLAVRFKIEEHWHIYWNGLNDTGVPPTIELSAPEGFEVQPIVWPTPKRHVAPGDLLDHVYEGDVLLLLPVKVPSSAARGTSVTFTAKAKWLVCNEMCVPEEADLTLKLPIAAAGAQRKPSADAPAFAANRERVPQPITSVQPDVSISWNGPKATIASKTASAMEFYPLEGGSEIASLLTSGVSASSTLKLTTRPEDGKPSQLDGVLALRYGKKWSYVRVQDAAKKAADASNRPEPQNNK